MARERPELRLVRESLESTLAPNLAQAALFEALELWGGELPDDRSTLEEWVRGELAGALSRRVGHQVASDVLADLLTSLAHMPAAPAAARRRAEDTATIPLDDAPVLALVLSGSSSLAMRIGVAMGPERVAPVTARDQTELEKRLVMATPAVVLIDAADFPAIEPRDLALRLAALPGTTLLLLWGADLPFGSAVLRELKAAERSPTPVDRREGFDPLLDLVRSRRR